MATDSIPNGEAIARWWELLGQHPTLMADILNARFLVKQRVGEWASLAGLSGGRDSLSDAILLRQDPPSGYLLDPATSWIMGLYPRLQRTAPPLPRIALVAGITDVIRLGEWAQGLPALLEQVGWNIHPVSAEVWLTTRQHLAAGGSATPSGRRAPHPSETVLVQTAYLHAEAEREICPDDTPRLTYMLRVPPGTSKKAIRAALSAALAATTEELGLPLDRAPRGRPFDMELWMGRYRDWWQWKTAEQHAHRDPNNGAWAAYRQASQGGLWSAEEQQPDKDLKQARYLFDRRKEGTGKTHSRPLTLPAASALFAELSAYGALFDLPP